MDVFSTFDRLLPVLRQQSIVTGGVFLLVTFLFLAFGVAGGYILRAFFQSTNKANDTWFAYVGTLSLLIGIIGLVIFLQMGLARVLNPSFYALEYYIHMCQALKGVYTP